MSINPDQALHELAVKLAELRAINSRSYPVEVWKRAISLANQFSVEKVCQVLLVQPAYFRKKMIDFGKTSEASFDFVEVRTKNITSSDLVTIELETPTGFKAKIHGASFCLCQVLNSLFREVL